ncbi:uncharacterized protein K441DRAFT_148096 [Cenococcum geophilum 1.58]|uniref:uncharacterized protein n=1 Tax=Cenococcum geophilum 1.58 TaxID=794803 RepID=UPI00358F379E|nr:hypothetical protein K441DRAFT_148096 [Cenococcum geophilum 1.58]
MFHLFAFIVLGFGCSTRLWSLIYTHLVFTRCIRYLEEQTRWLSSLPHKEGFPRRSNVILRQQCFKDPFGKALICSVTAQIFEWPSLTQNLIMHHNNNFLISSLDQGCLSPTYLLYI